MKKIKVIREKTGEEVTNERMDIIAQNGISISASNASNTIGFSLKREVTGNFFIKSGIPGPDGTAAEDGNLEADGDVVAFSTSDKRLKDNITLISNPIEKILQIGGYEFDWNEKQNTYNGHDVGVIAQEIEKVLPEVIQ